MTPSNVVGESAATALVVRVTACQLMGRLWGKKTRMWVRLGLNLTPLPPSLTNQALDQNQTLRRLRRIECLRRKQQRLKRRRLLQTPTCLSLWTTLGRTLRLSMSLRTLRAVNYTWILCWIRRYPTLRVLAITRGDATGDLFHPEALERTAPTRPGGNPTETQNQFQIYQMYHWSLKTGAEYRHCKSWHKYRLERYQTCSAEFLSVAFYLCTCTCLLKSCCRSLSPLVVLHLML